MRRRSTAKRNRMRTVVRNTAVIAGTTGLVAGGVYVMQSGGSSPGSGDAAQTTQAGLDSQVQLNLKNASMQRPAAVLAARVARRLGTRTAGAYLDSAGRPVVTVATGRDAAAVRAAGAVPRMLERSPATLSSMTATIRSSMTGMAGTGWGVDPANGQLVVWTDDTVAGTEMATVRRTLQPMGAAVRVVHIPGKLSTLAIGGDAIFGQGSRCSLGFNVKRGQQDFILTAGHCGNAVRNWTADPQGAQAVGTTVQSSFPRNDFALIQSEQGAGGAGGQGAGGQGAGGAGAGDQGAGGAGAGGQGAGGQGAGGQGAGGAGDAGAGGQGAGAAGQGAGTTSDQTLSRRRNNGAGQGAAGGMGAGGMGGGAGAGAGGQGAGGAGAGDQGAGGAGAGGQGAGGAGAGGQGAGGAGGAGAGGAGAGDQGAGGAGAGGQGAGAGGQGAGGAGAGDQGGAGAGAGGAGGAGGQATDVLGAVALGNGQTQDITEAADPVVGQQVSKSGSTTGVSTGQVTALNATVNFAEGTVTGMIQTSVCAEPGDSGGPLFSGSTALGLVSGGSGDCQAGGVTFFQPVTEALQVFNAQVF